VRGKIDVRALLLRLDDTDELRWLSRGNHQRHCHRMRKKVAEMNRDFRQGRQCAQIQLLTEWLIGIARTRRDMGGEVLDGADRVAREQKLAKRFWINPAIGSFAKGAVVEVEAIDVNVCYQFSGSTNAEAARRRLRARLPKQPGGYHVTIRY
jgi:hypothetical protein